MTLAQLQVKTRKVDRSGTEPNIVLRLLFWNRVIDGTVGLGKIPFYTVV